MTAQVTFLQETSYSPPPNGFDLRADGIWHEVKGNKGEAEWVWLCSSIRVLSLPRDVAGKGWGRLVEVIDPDGNVHRWSIPASMFAGDGRELLAGLLDLGLDLMPGRAARSSLMELLSRWQPAIRSTTTDRLGWTDETFTAFVLGDGQVIGSGDVVYQQDQIPPNVAEMKAAGTTAHWRNGVSEECAGNALMVTAVSLAFAGPLLEPLGMDGGGIHLRGASSRGKSTVLRVAVSVWGAPGFMHSWRATANGLEGVASTCNGSLLALDELGEVSGRDAGQATYMLANGTGKARANRAGMPRPTKRWRVMILSSGEITLGDKMAEAGGSVAAGQTVRLLDIAADGRPYGAFDALHGAADGAAFSDRLRKSTAEYFGTAGPAFVGKFLENLDVAKDYVRAEIDRFGDLAAQRFGVSEDGQEKRVLTRLGLIAAAGELATHYGLTAWKADEAMNAVLDVFGVWLEGRGGRGPSEARDAIERVREFLVANGSSRFERIDEDGGLRPVGDRAGWRDGTTYFIAVGSWREIHKGSDPTQAARHLHEAGFLDKGEGENLAVKLSRKLKGRPRAYAVSADIMGYSADDGGSGLAF